MRIDEEIKRARKLWVKEMGGWLCAPTFNRPWVSVTTWEPGRRLPTIWPFKLKSEIALATIVAQRGSNGSLTTHAELWEYLVEKAGVILWVEPGAETRWMVAMPHDHVALRLSPLRYPVVDIPGRLFQPLVASHA